MNETNTNWTKEDSNRAQQQGWDLFETTDQQGEHLSIQRCDESSAFKDDSEALSFVVSLAKSGSDLAIKACQQDAALKQLGTFGNNPKKCFEVTWEATAFTQSKHVAGAIFSEEEALGYTETSLLEKTFPAGILAVIKGYISADDAQEDDDIRVFVSVTVKQEVESADDIKRPARLLSKIIDLMGIDETGAIDLEIEPASWMISDTEEILQ